MGEFGDDQTRAQILKEARALFFRGMAAGWVVGAQETAVPDMPGYREITYQEVGSDYRLTDRFCVIPGSSRSEGATRIWKGDVPLWVMTYAGFYEQSVLGFLMRVLHRTYTDQNFFGGRGPHTALEGRLLYINIPVGKGFESFSGREEVVDTIQGGVKGIHDYKGMALI